jgi:hypothetical protein
LEDFVRNRSITVFITLFDGDVRLAVVVYWKDIFK